MNKIVYSVDGNAVDNFINKYPKVLPSMKPFLNKTKDMHRNYAQWIHSYKSSELGGNSNTVKSPTFGTKTFYKFDWNGVKGWAEVFQWLSIKVVVGV